MRTISYSCHTIAYVLMVHNTRREFNQLEQCHAFVNSVAAFRQFPFLADALWSIFGDYVIFGGLVILQLTYVGQIEIHMSRLFPA